MNLQVICSDCSISKFCHKNGTVPFTHNKVEYKCRLLNGYGKTALARHKVGKSLDQWEQSGKALTIVEHPTIVDEIFVFEILKIFHPPVEHHREKYRYQLSYEPKNHK